MPVVLLYLTFFVLMLLTAVFLIQGFTHSWWVGKYAAITITAGVSILAWIIIAQSYFYEVEYETFHEIKEMQVSYVLNNEIKGKRQVFYCDDKIYSAFYFFNQWNDEKQYQVKRTKLKHVYFGIDFEGHGKLANGCQYFLLEKKDIK